MSDIEEDVRCTSLKEAVKFAKRTNLLGIIAEATPLVSTTLKEKYLLIVSNMNPCLTLLCIGSCTVAHHECKGERAHFDDVRSSQRQSSKCESSGAIWCRSDDH